MDDRDATLQPDDDTMSDDTMSECSWDERAHEVVCEDSLFLRLDGEGEKFAEDVRDALAHISTTTKIDKIRLFIDADDVASSESWTDRLQTSFERILTNHTTISALFVHVGRHKANGVLGFSHDPAHYLHGKECLTVASSALLSTFEKCNRPLKSLCIGGYKCLDGDTGTCPGSEVTLSKVFDAAFQGRCLRELEDLDIGIFLPIQLSLEAQQEQMIAEASALRQLVAKLPALTRLALRWDQPYHDENRDMRKQQSVLMFPSQILEALSSITRLKRLQLRGFQHVREPAIRAILIQNDHLQIIEICRWEHSYGSLTSCLHQIDYASTTSKVARGATSVGGRKYPKFEMTKWHPTGCITFYENTFPGSAAVERPQDTEPPKTRPECVQRVLKLLEHCKLVTIVRAAPALVEKPSVVHDVATAVSATHTRSSRPERVVQAKHKVGSRQECVIREGRVKKQAAKPHQKAQS